MKWKKIMMVIYWCLAAVLVLMVASRSSFLYPCNNWDDANSYFTVGKSMFHGMVPYRDVFDQKGMYLYFLYGLCSLISFQTFAGVFLMEIILAVVDLALMHKILTLYCKPQFALAFEPVLLALMFSSTSFYWGGSAEEIFLPCILGGLYIFLRYAKNQFPEPMGNRELFIAGLLAGLVANIKFTSLGFFFAFMMMAGFAVFAAPSLTMGEKWKRFFLSCGIFLLGMALPFLPWVIYFAANHALYDWYDGYVYTNVFRYSTFGVAHKVEGPVSKIKTLILILYWTMRMNLSYFIAIGVGMVFILFRKGAKFLERIAPIVLFGFTFVGIYIGGAELRYYSMPLTAFAVLGFVAVGVAAEKLANKTKITSAAGANTGGTVVGSTVAGGMITAGTITTAVSLVVAFLLTYALSMNRYYLSYTKDDMFQYAFAKEMEERGIEDATMLNYNCLDAGLYTVAGVYPDCRWFQTQTLPGDEIFEAQYGYMKEGCTDYIVVRDDYPDFIHEQYEEIATFEQTMGENFNTYHLFLRKSDMK